MRVVSILLLCLVGATAELLMVQQITRHGIRGPKNKYYPKDCPGDPWESKWDVSNAALTGPGELSAYAVGLLTKKMYDTFIGPYNASSHYFRGCASERVLQTAEVVMDVVFPPGNGPQGGLPGRPQFAPIFSYDEDFDDLLKVEDGTCNVRSEADFAVWWASTGQYILANNRESVDPIQDFCGVQIKTAKKLKNQIDGLGFARAVGFLTPADLSDEVIFAAQNISIILQNGYFATDEAQTYLAGSLPDTLLQNMLDNINGDGLSYVAYFVHRQSLYAIAQFFGWTWNQYNLPEGKIHTGTTIWLELHGDRASTDEGSFTIQLKSFDPYCGEKYLENCPVTPIALPKCGTSCSLADFRSLVETRVNRTGTYKTLCA